MWMNCLIVRTANVNTLPSLVQHAPLIRLRRRALYKFVLIDWLIEVRSEWGRGAENNRKFWFSAPLAVWTHWFKSVFYQLAAYSSAARVLSERTFRLVLAALRILSPRLLRRPLFPFPAHTSYSMVTRHGFRLVVNVHLVSSWAYLYRFTGYIYGFRVNFSLFSTNASDWLGRTSKSWL